MSMRRVDVRLGERTYAIRILAGGLASAAEDLLALGARRAAVIYDQRVSSFAEQISASLQAAGIRQDAQAVPSGEASKSVAELARLWDWLVQLRADRQTWVVAVGGGVIGDLAGFVAASYARGIPFYQIPTTLLAQVDSSVGGKVGINLPQAKNMVGAFWQPRGVTIDPLTLNTLPDREYRSGLAEVVKYGVILDADFFAELERQVPALLARDPEVLGSVIARCCELKAFVVEQDERETTGLRAVLNYGHTFAHPFETLTGYGAMLHGEAVAIGMLCASRLAVALGRITPDITDRQFQLLSQLGLPTAVPALEPRQILDCMLVDKKTEHGKLRFVLPSRLGCVELVSGVSSGDVEAALKG